MITQFLGGPFGTITTPPIDQYGNAAHPDATADHHHGPGGHTAAPATARRSDAIDRDDHPSATAGTGPRPTTPRPADRRPRRAPRPRADSGPCRPPPAASAGNAHQVEPPRSTEGDA